MDDFSNDSLPDASNSTTDDELTDTNSNSKDAAKKDSASGKGSGKKLNEQPTLKDANKDSLNDENPQDGTPNARRVRKNGILEDRSARNKKTRKVTFKDLTVHKRTIGEDLKVMTIKEAQTIKETEVMPSLEVEEILLQPLVLRELLLSENCMSQLSTNNSIKGKITFMLVAFTIIASLLGHATVAPLMSTWYYKTHLLALEKFRTNHVRTPCAIIKNVNTEESNVTFYDIPYASFTHSFEDSHMVETFQDCYWHYYLLSNKEMVSFKNGIFFWEYDIMRQKHSDATAWRLQPRRPGASETTGISERLSLSIVTPSVGGKRPVIVLVTGNDLTFNKPILPGIAVSWQLDCVVVTVNYRLGLDGAGILNRENYMGNLFARDVIQALTWLNRTVGNFGGDANNIIYLGEGSGATLGLWLLISPESVFVNRFWLMDPSVEIPPMSEMGSIVEDIFLQQPSPFAVMLNEIQVEKCYNQYKHLEPSNCLNSISPGEVQRITPKWMKEIYNYLDEFPDKRTRSATERSLLYLPPSLLNYSLLHSLRARNLKLSDKPIVFHSSSASDFYSELFPLGRRIQSRFKVETDMRQSLERLYIKRNSRVIGTDIVQQYVDLMKAEVREDDIDYEEVRRMLLHDIRALCPVQALIYHLVIQKLTTHPVYNLLDLSSYQSIPIVVGRSDLHCNLPRFMVHDFDEVRSNTCRLAFDVGAEGQRQLRSYRAVAIGMLADFAHHRTQSEHHPQHMVAAVGSHGSEGFETSVNLLDHRGNLPGMETKRSQLVKTVCHHLYGSLRNDWHALLYTARYN